MLRLETLLRRWRGPTLAITVLLFTGCNSSFEDDSATDTATDTATVADTERAPLEDPAGGAEASPQDDATLTDELVQLRTEAAEEEARLAEKELLLRERELQLARNEQQEDRERLIRERERHLAEHERQARAEAAQLARERAELAATERRIAEAREELEAEAESLEPQPSVATAGAVDTGAGAWSGEEGWRDRHQTTPVRSDQTPAATEAARPSAAEQLRAGMELEVEILDNLSSRDSKVGDMFRTELAADVVGRDGTVILPAGTQLIGAVIDARPLRQVGGQAALGLEFHELILDSGERIEIEATFLELGKNQKKDKKKIAGAAVAGAILGRILGDGEAAIVGGLVGAAAGTAAVMKSKGQEVEIPSGTIVRLELTEVITMTTKYGRVVDDRN